MFIHLNWISVLKDNTNNWYQSTNMTSLNSVYYDSSTFANTFNGDIHTAMSFIFMICAIYSGVLNYELQVRIKLW